jgi:hypothetical protein
MGTCAVVGATKEMTIIVEEDLMGSCKKLVGVVEGYRSRRCISPS